MKDDMKPSQTDTCNKHCAICYRPCNEWNSLGACTCYAIRKIICSNQCSRETTGFTPQRVVIPLFSTIYRNVCGAHQTFNGCPWIKLVQNENKRMATVLHTTRFNFLGTRELFRHNVRYLCVMYEPHN